VILSYRSSKYGSTVPACSSSSLDMDDPICLLGAPRGSGADAEQTVTV
jgi:hypothetical protein